MGQRIAINRDGVFKLNDRTYRIPWTFSRRPVLSYRLLTEPLQVSPSLKPLTAEQRIDTRKYLLWRAAACRFPSFGRRTRSRCRWQTSTAYTSGSSGTALSYLRVSRQGG